MQIADLTHEKTRTYIYPGEKIEIEGPVALTVSDDGYHLHHYP